MAGAKAIDRARDAYLVQPLRDPDEIRSLLRPRRRYTAYGLAQLELPLFKQARFWQTEDDGDRALLMHSRGGLGHALLTLGDEIGLYVLLSLHPGPAYSFATIDLEHLPVMRRFYSLSQTSPMQRMVVDRRSFVAAPPLEPGAASLRRLSGDDTPDVNRLNASEGAGISYAKSQIRDGLYFGAYVDGLLVSMAGTHAVSKDERIAVLGNVLTHPGYRGRHFALQTSSAVTSALLDECDEVVLTVDPRNEPAVRAYTRLGYVEDCQLIEAVVTRRESLALGSLMRRLIARWRGRRYGRELVYSPARRG